MRLIQLRPSVVRVRNALRNWPEALPTVRAGRPGGAQAVIESGRNTPLPEDPGFQPAASLTGSGMERSAEGGFRPVGHGVGPKGSGLDDSSPRGPYPGGKHARPQEVNLSRLCRVRVLFPDIGLFPILEDVAVERWHPSEVVRDFLTPDQVVEHLAGLTTP